ncbi:MAG TPA: 23S rRNA pseudouridine(1911/1915/1917) synthase RluD [Steroidobacteraceae bacterium]|nr:23S rRNA pseudouridine(1911/1915/1917) synthase RluD [Steroidobacteraceae bacterium]HNS27042.1 23S rRNA pseudouridine(1911/1915/1917) synthase RluD [Steroidobacteraceae bacterium]
MTAEFRRHDLQLSPTLAGMRLDQALASALPQYSRSRIQGWIERGTVLVDGRVARSRDRVLGGERVVLEGEVPLDTGTAPQAMALEVVYEDEQVLVIDKPAGLVVHPGAGNRDRTLQNGLLARDPRLAQVPRAGLVHRLDKDTSGLMVVARTIEAHAALVAMLAAREVSREYLAIVTGVMTGGGTIDEPIGRHRAARTRMAVRADGRPAITHYRIVERFRSHTLARVTLETGRTHQIRVHLAHIGYPILGDPVYGVRRRLTAGATPALLEALHAFRRQALHAARLAFVQPVSGEALEFEAPMPADMRGLVEVLRADARGA